MVWFHTGVRCKDDMVFILVRCNDGMVFILVWRCKGMVLITCVMQRWYGFHTREALRRYGFYYSCHAEMVWFWYSCHPEMVWFSYSWRVWFDWATSGDLRGCVILRWYGLKTRDMLVWFGWLVRRSLLVAKLVRRNHTLFWLSKTKLAKHDLGWSSCVICFAKLCNPQYSAKQSNNTFIRLYCKVDQ